VVNSDRAPQLWPLTLVLSGVLWIVATSGGQHLFVKEVLGEAFDSQAEHFLRGDAGVDLDAIRPEAMAMNGKIRMYFGPFPALFRIPLNLVYPEGRGMWSRFSGFCAGLIALWSFAGLVGDSLRSSSLRAAARNWMGNAAVAGFFVATPFLFLIGNLSIFNEAIIWALGWSVSALFFAIRTSKSEERTLTWSLFGFSFSVAGALLSRVSFALPLLLIAALLAFRMRQAGWRRLAALAGPLVVGMAFYLLISYARFGNFSGIRFDSYINSTHREFARQHGMFNLARVPFSFSDYFSLRSPGFHSQPPFVQVDRHFLAHPTLFSLPNSECFLSLLWASSWMLVGAIFGLLYLFSAKRSSWFDRCVAAALFVQVICILSYFALAQRYLAELLPFFIFAFVIFLRNGGILFQRLAVVTLVAASAAINSLGTAFWLANDGNLPLETRVFWSAVAGQNPPAK
jgi:hypothetical protein